MTRACLKCGGSMREYQRECVSIESGEGNHAVALGYTVVYHDEPHCEAWGGRETRIECVAPGVRAGVAHVNPSKRQLVVDIARSQIGKSDPGVYWSEVLPKTTRPPYPKHWCGAGYLWCLHQAGLATEVQWRIGMGLSGAMQRAGLSFPTTKSPQSGDMAYFTRNQHHAVVVEVSGGLVRVVNFNGAGGRVTETVHPLANVAVFFSIEKLVASGGR